MNYQDLIHDAIDVVLAQDVSDDAFSYAVRAQASFMAGHGSD